MVTHYLHLVLHDVWLKFMASAFLPCVNQLFQYKMDRCGGGGMLGINLRGLNARNQSLLLWRFNLAGDEELLAIRVTHRPHPPIAQMHNRSHRSVCSRGSARSGHLGGVWCFARGLPKLPQTSLHELLFLRVVHFLVSEKVHHASGDVILSWLDYFIAIRMLICLPYKFNCIIRTLVHACHLLLSS